MRALSVANLSRRTIFNAVFMRRKNYPYEQVVKYLNDRHPGRKVYTGSSSATVHLGDLAWLGPGYETILPVTPKLTPVTEQLQRELQVSSRVGAVVATGMGCENWKASGPFEAGLRDMVVLEQKFGLICIFAASRHN